MQVDPMKSMLKPPGTKHLKLKRDILLSTFAFKIKLRRYTEDAPLTVVYEDECVLAVDKPAGVMTYPAHRLRGKH